MLSKEEYFEFYYKMGKCIDQMVKPNNKLNEKSLTTKYKNYVRKEEHKLNKVAKDYSEWDLVREEVFKRDGYKCRLYSILSPNEKNVFKLSGGYLHGELDPAHVIPRSVSSHLYYDVDNIVALNRTFHSRLDTNCDPLTGIAINKSMVDDWWIRIVGIKIFTYLLKNK